MPTSLVPVEATRVVAEPTADGVRIAIGRRRRFSQWLTAVWTLLIVTIGGVAVAVGDVEDDGSGWFLLLWFGLGGTFCALALYGLLHRESVELTRDELVVERRLGPHRHRRAFARGEVDDLRVSPDQVSAFDPRAGLRQYGIGGGSVAFDYGARTVRFGQVEEAEAKRVVRALAQHLA